MTYLEVIHRNGKNYYYVTKNFRTSSKKWRKMRKYFGLKKPDSNTIKEAITEVEKEALKKGYHPRPKYLYLDEKDAEILEDLRDAYNKWYGKLRPEDQDKYQSDFLIRFTYNTNAIEGNRLSLRETAMIFTEGVIPSGATTNDYNETLNSRDAFELMKKYKGELNQRFLFKIHKEITKNTNCRITGGYRDSEVRISGSEWIPPSSDKIKGSMIKFFQWYNNHKKRLHPVELGALVHIRLTQIHPFTDGNGRIARLIMNWILFKKRYPMFYVETRDKINYYNAIDVADRGDPRVFIGYIGQNIISQFTFISEKES